MSNKPSVYVSTYAKYNEGNLKGEWIDLEKYDTQEKFLKKIKTLHADESDPEFMIQDYENLPNSLYHEHFIDIRVWDYLELSEDDREIVTIYLDKLDSSATIQESLDSYNGVYDSPEDWAYEYLRDSGQLSGFGEVLQNYFDYKAYARDAELEGSVNFVKSDNGVMVFFVI